jgi:hypothetical protein
MEPGSRSQTLLQEKAPASEPHVVKIAAENALQMKENSRQ